LHISIDPSNPDLAIRSTGQAVIQCEMISACYAQDSDNESPETMWALVFDAEGQVIQACA